MEEQSAFLAVGACTVTTRITVDTLEPDAPVRQSWQLIAVCVVDDKRLLECVFACVWAARRVCTKVGQIWRTALSEWLSSTVYHESVHDTDLRLRPPATLISLLQCAGHPVVISAGSLLTEDVGAAGCECWPVSLNLHQLPCYLDSATCERWSTRKSTTMHTLHLLSPDNDFSHCLRPSLRRN